jgi:hypothetical protein
MGRMLGWGEKDEAAFSSCAGVGGLPDGGFDAGGADGNGRQFD